MDHGADPVGRRRAFVTGYRVERLAWRDVSLGDIELPRGRLCLSLGLGSGLSIRPGDASGTIWAIGDRGPNLKVGQAVDDYGLDHLRRLKDVDGAKIMPRPDIGPTIVELRLEEDAVRLVRALPLRGTSGRPISGLPIPEDAVADVEPAFDLEGNRLAVDPSGADTEGIAALSDGTFFVGDEYAPSIFKVDASGTILCRWVPDGQQRALAGADYPVCGVLPAIAAKRRLNRGFEALAVSPDSRWLYVMFQSALALPDKAAFEHGRHVRLWKLDVVTGAVAAQFIYPFDAPATFTRDRQHGDVARSDLKIGDAAAIGPDRLLVLERISHTTKIYAVDLDAACAVPESHLDASTRPTLEQMTPDVLGAHGIQALAKTLIVSTDDAPDVGRDLEGLVALSPRELLLVNDNDFGIEGVDTGFWRVHLPEPLALAT